MLQLLLKLLALKLLIKSIVVLNGSINTLSMVSMKAGVKWLRSWLKAGSAELGAWESEVGVSVAKEWVTPM